MEMELRAGASRVAAKDVLVGDRICFNQPRFDVTVDRLSETPDGRIGFHGNDETWSTWRNPDEIVWIDSMNRLRLSMGFAAGDVDRLKQIQRELEVSGFRMEYDPGSIPGEGHCLVSIETGELMEEPAESVGRLAKEWSDLTDDIERDAVDAPSAPA